MQETNSEKQHNRMSVEIKTPTKTQFQHGPWRERKESVGRRTISASRTTTAASGGGSRANNTTSSGGAQNNNKGSSHQHHHHHHHHRNHSAGSNPQHGRGRGDRQQSVPGRIGRKRRYSERVPGEGHGNPFKKRFGRYGRHEKIVLPTKFLLGGNINDPLNLNSLCDEEINKALNEKTPVSSPLPLPPHKGEVKVLIPPNIRDPLGLDSEFDPKLVSPKLSEGKKRKHKRKNLNLAISPIVLTEDAASSQANKGSSTAPVTMEKKDFTRPMHINIDPNINAAQPGDSHYRDSSSEGVSATIQKIQDKIVSPVIPQKSPKKRKRRSSECRQENANVARALIKDGDKTMKDFKDKTSPHRPKFRKQPSNQSTTGKHSRRSSGVNQNQNQKPNKKNEKFVYGNYNRYYGYRNPNQDDQRLKVFKEEWFKSLDVLDIGCNVGHVTLHIAHKFKPRSIVGTDIDSSLIAAARKNIRHYLQRESKEVQKFPESMKRSFGPIIAPQIPQSPNNVFPNNISFVTGNFVPEKDELVDLQKEEYDVILVLSVTKWIHLNHGDDGLKRAFKRMIRALRPGGRLILEPQGWPSYKRKKKLTERIADNYRKIRFRPDQFTEFLLSREVGFSKCETLAMPFNKAKVLSSAVQVTGGPPEPEWLAPVTRGFQRPIQIFTKPETAQATPQWSWNITPNRGSGPNTPWWEAMEAQQAAGVIVNPPIVTMSPLVESPVTTMSPLVETTETAPSPLVEEDGTKQRQPHLVAAGSVDSVATSGIDSPAAPFDDGLIGADSHNNTPTVKFTVGSSSGFCTPCDSAGQSPNPMYSQFLQQTSYQPAGSASPKTPTREDSTGSLLRVQSAPGLIETAPFRRKSVPQVGTAPGLLETSFCNDSCDSECCSACSQDSDNHDPPLEGVNGVDSPRDTVTSSQADVDMEEDSVQASQSAEANQSEAVNTPPDGAPYENGTSRDLVSESEVSSTSDMQR